MNIRIDINVCRVCLQASDGVSIFSDDILEKFLFTTLVQVSVLIWNKQKQKICSSLNSTTIKSILKYNFMFDVELIRCYSFIFFASVLIVEFIITIGE